MQELSISTASLLSSEAAYQELRQVIECSVDRYTGNETFAITLPVTPLAAPTPASSQLVILKDVNRIWAATLLIGFDVRGGMGFPSAGDPVYWLINDQRFTSQILSSNGQTATKTFRVGTDVMPGPLMVWMSAPVTTARTTGTVCVWVTEEIMLALTQAGTADFRVGMMEFRLSGQYDGRKGSYRPVAPYIAGLRALAEEKPNAGDSQALLAIIDADRTHKQQHRRRSIIAVLCVVIIVPLIPFLVGLLSYSGAIKKSDQFAPLTDSQRGAVEQLLTYSDKLDAMYKANRTGKDFIDTAKKLEAQAVDVEKTLPRGNAARDLFVNSMKAYQEATVDLMSQGRVKKDKPDATILAAGMRKALLRKVLVGSLSPEEEKIFKEWATTAASAK